MGKNSTGNSKAAKEEREKELRDKRRWIIGTCLTVVGVLIAATGLLATNWDTWFGDDAEIAITSKHGDFKELAYGDELNLCIPFIKEHLEEAFADWTADSVAYGIGAPGGSLAKIDDLNATGQSLLNTVTSIRNLANMQKSTDTGKNILTCLNAPYEVGDQVLTQMDVDSLSIGGPDAPFAYTRVVSESPVLLNSVFARSVADERPVKVMQTETNGDIQQIALTQVAAAHASGQTMWAKLAILQLGSEYWIEDLPAWDGDL
jgi:hypothetical protein